MDLKNLCDVSMHSLVTQKSFTLLVCRFSAMPFSIGELAATAKIPAKIATEIFIVLVFSNRIVTEQQNWEKPGTIWKNMNKNQYFSFNLKQTTWSQRLRPKKQSMVLKIIPGWLKIIIIFIKSVPSWALLRISVNVFEKNLVLIVLGFGTPQEFRVQLLVLAWVWLLPLLSALVFCPHFEKRNSPVVHCARFSSILLPVAKLSVKLRFLCEATEGKYIVCKFSTFQPMFIKYLDFDGPWMPNWLSQSTFLDFCLCFAWSS